MYSCVCKILKLLCYTVFPFICVVILYFVVVLIVLS